MRYEIVWRAHHSLDKKPNTTVFTGGDMHCLQSAFWFIYNNQPIMVDATRISEDGNSKTG